MDTDRWIGTEVRERKWYVCIIFNTDDSENIPVFIKPIKQNQFIKNYPRSHKLEKHFDEGFLKNISESFRNISFM